MRWLVNVEMMSMVNM